MNNIEQIYMVCPISSDIGQFVNDVKAEIDLKENSPQNIINGKKINTYKVNIFDAKSATEMVVFGSGVMTLITGEDKGVKAESVFTSIKINNAPLSSGGFSLNLNEYNKIAKKVNA